MSQQIFHETLVSQNIAGTQFGAFTTAKTVIPPICLIQFPPNFLYVGKRFRTTVRGGLSTLVTTPGTITFQIMIGSVIAWTSGAIQMNATAHTLLPFTLVIDWRVVSIGNGTIATIIGMGTLNGIQFTLTAGQTDAANTGGSFSVPATAPAAGTGFDSTIANVLDFFAGFSINNAANLIQVQFYDVESLN